MGKVRKLLPLANDKVPNRESMDSNFRFIVKKGLMDTYDIQLKTIADNYLSTQNKNAINAKVANNNT